jgi:hypothetical protein
MLHAFEGVSIEFLHNVSRPVCPCPVRGRQVQAIAGADGKRENVII